MAIPKQIQKQSEDVQALYKELNEEPEKNAVEESAEEVAPEAKAETETEVPVEEDTTASSDSVEKQAPISEAEEHSTSDSKEDKESWEHKYKTLQGMYNSDVPRLNAQNRDLNTRISSLENLLSNIDNNSETPTETPAAPLLTDKEAEEYGESIDIMRKVTKEEVAGQTARLAKMEQDLKKLQANVVPQVEQVKMQQKSSAEAMFWDALTREVPNWNEINKSQEFQNWLLEVDPLTGLSRQTYLEDAQQKLESGRVIKFFQLYETSVKGNANDARETQSENSELVKQVVPGRGRAGKTVAGEGKTYTTSDIKKFFEDVRFGRFKGREDERGKIERDIFAAQREGRIVN